MKKIIINGLLLLGVIVPLILLFWPFVSWGNAMSLVLRIIPSVSAQILFCRATKRKGVQAIPFLLTGGFALWVTDVYLTSPNWNRASFWRDYVADCLSPFLCCLVVYLVSVFLEERKGKHGCIEGNNEE